MVLSKNNNYKSIQINTILTQQNLHTNKTLYNKRHKRYFKKQKTANIYIFFNLLLSNSLKKSIKSHTFNKI